MNEVNLIEFLGQVPTSETSRVFRDFLCGHVREMICEVMAAEVTELYGPKHAPTEADFYRTEPTLVPRFVYQRALNHPKAFRAIAELDDAVLEAV